MSVGGAGYDCANWFDMPGVGWSLVDVQPVMTRPKAKTNMKQLVDFRVIAN